MKRLLILALALLTSFAVFAQGGKSDGKITPKTEQNSSPVELNNGNRNDLEAAKAMELFFNVMQNLNVFYVDTINNKKITETAINAMLKQLDPYTEYISGEGLADFDFQTTGKYAGIGSLIRQRGSWVEIAEPYKGTPSDRAGMKAGDRLLEIDGQDLKGFSTAKVSSMLKGEPNTQVKIKIRPIIDTNSTKDVIILREKISVPSVPYYGMVSDSVGYIQFVSFTESAASEVERAILELKKNPKFNSVILDLRGNGGGVIDPAIKIVSFFVDPGTTVVNLKGRNGQENRTYVTKGEPIAKDIQLAILVNNGTASASEILAGAIQDLDRGVIIGRRSYGKGLVQTSRQVDKKALLKLTIAKYYTPSGRCIQALDYSHRREDGSVEHVPDSIIKEFTTLGGRKVYDGGGINPDVKVDAQYWSKFTAILVAYGFLDDFSNIFAAYNEPVAGKDFVVTDEIYKQFVDFMQDKTITYKSASEIALANLKKEATDEKYLDRIDGLLTEIENKIKEDKNTELKNFEAEIKEALANSIVNRWFYNSGVIERAINRGDKEVEKAIEVLRNRGEYNRILKSQDTSRN